MKETKKKETALDHEIAAMDVALENQDNMSAETSEALQEMEPSEGYEDSEGLADTEDAEPTVDSEDSEATADTEDNEEKEKLNSLFSNYPATLESLGEDDEFKVTEKTERFMASVEGYARGSGCARDELDKSLAMLFSIGRGVRDGNMNLDMLDTIWKGLRHDETLMKEVRAAELRGRNANIEAKVRTKGADDGLPHIESRNSGKISNSRSRGIFGLAEGAK